MCAAARQHTPQRGHPAGLEAIPAANARHLPGIRGGQAAAGYEQGQRAHGGTCHHLAPGVCTAGGRCSARRSTWLMISTGGLIPEHGVYRAASAHIDPTIVGALCKGRVRTDRTVETTISPNLTYDRPGGDKAGPEQGLHRVPGSTEGCSQFPPARPFGCARCLQRAQRAPFRAPQVGPPSRVTCSQIGQGK